MTSMFGQVGAAQGEEPVEKNAPISTMKCGARVWGERLGHCNGPDCGWGDGCCRNFYGITAWDKHYTMRDGRKHCHSDEDLIERGLVHDGPSNSWRVAGTAVVPGSMEDPE